MSLTANGEPLQLLRTKLYRPRPNRDLVHRTRLHEALERYLDKTMTLVCAPAGFGKTTMLTDWLEQCAHPSAWLSLDKSDGDLAVFLAYFVSAVRTLFPSSCADSLALLQAPVLPPLASLVTALVNDLDRLADEPQLSPGVLASGRFIMVLDDYHLVREPVIHNLLGELLRHPPRTMHLILSARQDPPFLNQTLRARGDFSEIRIAELRFTPDEAASLMQHALQTQLEAETVASLVDSTEGWGTGLRLTALTLKAGGGVRSPEPISYNRYTSDYLIAEVLSHVPVATQEFLLKTSILDRLSGPLCDAVAPPADPEWDGRAYLEWLATENLFTFSLDSQGNWYRYHHLFQRLLQVQLQRRRSAEEVNGLHARAAGWYAEHGLIQEAIEHALAAHDELMAAQLVEKHRLQAMNRELWRQLEQWLSLLPRRLIDTRAELLLVEAWIIQKQWRLTDLPAYLDRIEALMLRDGIAQEPVRAQPPGLDDTSLDRSQLAGEVDSLRGMASFYLLDWTRSFACAERALATLRPEYSFARSNAWMYLASGRVMAGDVQSAFEALHEALKEDRVHGDSFPTRPYVGLCHLYSVRADLINLVLTATQMLQIAQQRDLIEATGWAHYFRGCARYQQNDLAAAEEEFAAVFRQQYLMHAFPFSQSAFGLVLTLAALGEYARAREVLDSVAAYSIEMHNGRVMLDAEAIRACLARRTGAIAEAHRWATSFDPATPLVPLTTFSVPHILRAGILVAEASPSSLAAAARDLARLHDFAASMHSIRYLIEVLALQALIHDGQGNQSAAFAALEQALDLAEPGGLIRVFVDLGPSMAALLGRLVVRSDRRSGGEYRQKVLAAFVPAAPAAVVPQFVAGQPLSPPAAGWHQADAVGLFEPLSRRELDVLLLLSERLTDKEIARELFVSPQTVKRHASNIYQKLDVGNRRDAVAKAAALGLLPASHTVRRQPPPAH
ncbi:MAG: LuxR C-terminal-related transcriptional regulator [Nitrososphaerales archaeon]